MKTFFHKRRAAPDPSRLPRHIAIIMDGNGRWATRRGLPRVAGHKAGSEAFRQIVYRCRDLGVRYLTVYAFSTENWNRPQTEVDGIMVLLKQYLLEVCEKMIRENIGMRVMGDVARLTPELREIIARIDMLSKKTTGLQVQVCINYGGRAELVHAAQSLARRVQAGLLSPEDIDETALSAALYSGGIPDPDLVIRPGDERRISNFLLWQSAYAEYYFTPTLWPDFTPACLEEAIADYQRRDRRFGGVGKAAAPDKTGHGK